MAQHLKVHELLKRDELDELEGFAREPGRTIDECHEWLQARGFTLSRGAVGNWKQKFDERCLAERFSRSAELAASLRQAIDRDGVEKVAEAAVRQLTQVVFEQSVMLESEGAVSAKDVQRWASSLKLLLDSNREARSQAVEAVAAGEKAAAEGASAGDVVTTIKKALGIAA